MNDFFKGIDTCDLIADIRNSANRIGKNFFFTHPMFSKKEIVCNIEAMEYTKEVVFFLSQQEFEKADTKQKKSIIAEVLKRFISEKYNIKDEDLTKIAKRLKELGYYDRLS